MDNKTESVSPVQLSEVIGTDETAQDGATPSRRDFVEPAVSFPVDVLASTTFFQFTESGATN